jgi:uncharacterized membrane protein SpoIIM required for sporulation
MFNRFIPHVKKGIIIPISFSFIVYLISFIIGFIIIPLSPSLDGIKSQAPVNLSLTNILFNNCYVWLLMVGGSCLMGLPTMLSLVYNEFIFGINIYSIGLSLPLFMTLVAVLPHGILEICGFILAGASGFKIPYEIIKYLAKKKDYILNKSEIIDLFYMSTVSLALIVLAAFIEAYVTFGLVRGG